MTETRRSVAAVPADSPTRSTMNIDLISWGEPCGDPSFTLPGFAVPAFRLHGATLFWHDDHEPQTTILPQRLRRRRARSRRAAGGRVCPGRGSAPRRDGAQGLLRVRDGSPTCPDRRLPTFPPGSCGGFSSAGDASRPWSLARRYAPWSLGGMAAGIVLLLILPHPPRPRQARPRARGRCEMTPKPARTSPPSMPASAASADCQRGPTCRIARTPAAPRPGRRPTAPALHAGQGERSALPGARRLAPR